MNTSQKWNLLAAAALAVALLAVIAAPATADAVYHSQHIQLVPAGSSPLQSGFVENIHPDGLQVYAHELYVLNGAQPEANYQVTLLLYPFDPNCASAPAAIPTASFETNAAGDGLGQFVLHPADVPTALKGATHGIRWLVASAGSTYSTACSSVTLD